MAWLLWQLPSSQTMQQIAHGHLSLWQFYMASIVHSALLSERALAANNAEAGYVAMYVSKKACMPASRNKPR